MVEKTVTILGATGSIGKSTLSIIRQHPDKFRVVALTGNKNTELLIEQAKEFRPEIIAVVDESEAKALRDELKGIKILSGREGLCGAASLKADITIAGIVGFAGLEPTMAAVSRGGRIGLANKEAMVCAGSLMLDAAKGSGAEIIPVDSEHNAIYQVFDFKNPGSVERIILTASGGPFRGFSLEELRKVTPEQAVNHPNWKMGAKISVDSATMMNKGLEVIEAYYLFPVKPEQIEVIVHPESIIHSMVDYCDGSVLAQASNPDMRVPISYVLGYPERLKNNTKRLNLAEFGRLHFEAPDNTKFPCLQLARDAMLAGAGHQVALNAANEIAVDKFLNKQIKFTDIASVVAKSLERHKGKKITKLEDVFAVDEETRQLANGLCRAA